MPMLQKALKVAYFAHDGQVDKGGNPYILHPLFVALTVDNTDEKVVALLHDVVEDTPIGLDELRKQGFPQKIVDAVSVLTREDGEDYFDYLSRVKDNKLALAVKKADLRHNMDLSRLKGVTSADAKRIAKYQQAMSYLKK